MIGSLRSLLTSVAWLAAVASPLSLPATEIELRSSKARLGSIEVGVQHRIDVSSAIRSFDIDKPGTVSIPGTAVLSTTTGLICGGVIVPPGNHRIGLHVGDDGIVHFTLRSLVSRDEWRWMANVGEFDRPSPGVRVLVGTETVTASEGDRHRGRLQVRWRAWVFEAEFDPVETSPIEVAGWRLDTNKLAPERDGETALAVFLGTITDSKSGRRRRIFLDRTSSSYAVRFTDVRLENLAWMRWSIEAEIGGLASDQPRQLEALRSRLQTVDSELRDIVLQDAQLGGRMSLHRREAVAPALVARLSSVSGTVQLEIAGPFGTGRIRLVVTPAKS